jgi:glycosyltransferase involved in cell wall biosynthesis
MTLLDKTNTLVIIPAYNEQDSIGSVIEEIKATGFPFVVIDDGSTDETRNRAITAGARTISLPFNAGVGGSLKCGFQHAVAHGYAAVIQCDADGQHPTTEFENLVAKANQGGFSMVVGNRFFEGDMTEGSKRKKYAIRLFRKLIYWKSGQRVSDPTCGLKIVRIPLLAHFANRFPSNYLGDTFEAAFVASKENYLIGETFVTIRPRFSGVSSASDLAASLNVLKSVFRAVLSLHFKIPSDSMSKINTMNETRK